MHPKCPPFLCWFSARTWCKFSYFTNSKLTLGVKFIFVISLMHTLSDKVRFVQRKLNPEEAFTTKKWMVLAEHLLAQAHIWIVRLHHIIAKLSLVINASSGLSFLWTNLTLPQRVCIKEIIKINLTPKVSFELVKYENLHQVRAENWQRKGGHFGCTASVVVLFASFFFRQFSFCCLTGHSQNFLMLVKTAHNYL